MGNHVAPAFYVGHYDDPTLGGYYLDRVHVKEQDGFQGKRTVSAHDSAIPLATYLLTAIISHFKPSTSQK